MSSRQVVESTLSVVAYSTCSVLMIIINKLLLNVHELNYPNSLLLLQNGGAVILVVLAKYFGLVDYADISLAIVKKWMPLTLFFVSMLFTSMMSLGTMSVASQTIIKNLAIILTALGDKILYRKRQNKAVYGAFLLMLLGSYLGAKGDQWVTPTGLFWTFMNIFFTVAYTLYMKKVLAAVGASAGRYGPVLYNNLLSLPFFILLGYDEIPRFHAAVKRASVGTIFLLLLSTVISSAMTYAVFWCMSVTSPTTFSVFGALNKVPIAIIGIVVFQQYPTATGYVGICLALSAGLLYTYINTHLNQVKEPREEVKEDHTTEVVFKEQQPDHRHRGQAHAE